MAIRISTESPDIGIGSKRKIIQSSGIAIDPYIDQSIDNESDRKQVSTDPNIPITFTGQIVIF